MTAQIDFYILDTPNLNGSVHFITRLADKVYRLGNAIKIKGEIALLNQIDQALWLNFDFIPHHLNRNSNRITINRLFDKKPFVLVNLTSDPAKDPTDWQRLIHIVANEPQQKQAARETYRHYQQSGLTIKSHNIKVLKNGP